MPIEAFLIIGLSIFALVFYAAGWTDAKNKYSCPNCKCAEKAGN